MSEPHPTTVPVESYPSSVTRDDLDGETEYPYAYYCATCENAVRTEDVGDHAAEHADGGMRLGRVDLVAADGGHLPSDYLTSDLRERHRLVRDMRRRPIAVGDGGRDVSAKGMVQVVVETATPQGEIRVTMGVNHHVQGLLAEVLARMGRRFNRGDVGQYDLVLESGQPLNPLHTLGQTPVEDGDTVRLDVNPVGGI